LQQYLERIQLQERHQAQLEQDLATALKEYEDAVVRLAQIPGLGADSAQQIIAEVGPQATKFPTAAHLCSWVGTCPGQEESAGQSTSDRSPKGNRPMRRILNQAAQAAIRSKGTVFAALYQRIRGRDPKKHKVAVWAVANRLCRLVWKILHQMVDYQEQGQRPDPRAVRHRANRLLRQLRALGYSVQAQPPQPQGCPT
jgi:transposase